MFSKALLFATVVLWTHQVVESRSKFVLGIRNGTLFLQETQAADSRNNTTEFTSNDQGSVYQGIVNDTPTKEMANSMVRDDEGDRYTASGWSEIEKLLDTDISSVPNREKNRQIFASQNRTGNATHETLQAILSEEDNDNSLEDSQTIMDSIMAENNPGESNDVEASDMFDESYGKREMMNNAEYMNKTMNDLTNAVQQDCINLLNKKSKVDIEMVAPSNHCEKIDVRGGKHLPGNIAKLSDHQEVYNDTKNSTLEEGMMSNASVHTKDNINTKINDSNHDLSIIEVQMLPDDYTAKHAYKDMRPIEINKELNNDTSKEVASTNVVEYKKIEDNEWTEEDSEASQRHSEEKGYTNDTNVSSNRTESTSVGTFVDNGNITTTGGMNNGSTNATLGEMATNMTHNANNDTSGEDRNTIQNNSTSSLNIIEIQMLSGDVTNTNIGSKRHIPFRIDGSYRKTLNEVMKSSNAKGYHHHNVERNKTIMHSDGNKRFLVSNTSADTAQHGAPKNITKEKKKHHIVSHDTVSNDKKAKHHDIPSNTTHNETIKMENAHANITLNAEIKNDKGNASLYNKEKKESSKNAIKRNKVQHREKSKSKSSITHSHKKRHRSRSKHSKSSSSAANKRRLVSNHVPFHRENNETKFKNLNKEDAENKKNGNRKVTKQPPSAGPLTPKTSTQVTSGNQTKSDETIGNINKNKSNSSKNINVTDAFSQRPTISPRGIDKHKSRILQTATEGEEAPIKANTQEDTDVEYVRDNKYPNLGIFRHPKQAGSSNKTKEAQEGSEVIEVINAKPSDDKDEAEVTRKTLNNDTLLFYNGTVENTTDSPPNMTLKRILCFGDSLTKGIYARGEIHHPYTIKMRQLFGRSKLINYNIINHGVNGECVSRIMKSRLDDDLRTLPKLDLVIILGGTNDLLHEDCSRKVDLFQEIKSMHTLVRDKGYKSVVVTIPESHTPVNGTDKMTMTEYNDAIEDVNQKLRVFAATEKLPLCDLADEFPRHTLPGKTNMASLWDDKFYPTAKGYDRIGEIIYDDIKGFV